MSAQMLPLLLLLLLLLLQGVKYLHHEAKAFDVGIYFESNGHGTVLFKPSLLQRLQDMDENVSTVTKTSHTSVHQLAGCISLSPVCEVCAMQQTDLVPAECREHFCTATAAGWRA
jgi:hypothetical protein